MVADPGSQDAVSDINSRPAGDIIPGYKARSQLAMRHWAEAKAVIASPGQE